MPEKVEKCVKDKLADSGFTTYYDSLVKKKGKEFKKKFPDKKSLAWAICTKSVEGNYETIDDIVEELIGEDKLEFNIEVLNIVGTVSRDEKAVEDFKDIKLFSELSGKPNKKPIIYDLMPIDTISEHEGTKVYFPLKAVKGALQTVLMTPIHITGDREHHFEEDGTAIAIGHVVATKVKKIKGTNYLRIAGFLYDKDYPTEIAEIERWKKELGASFEVYPKKVSQYDKGVVSIDEFEFSGSAILKKTAAAYPTAQVVMASKNGDMAYLDLEYFDKAKELGTEIKADRGRIQGMILPNSFQELNNLIRAKLHENDPNYDLDLVATFTDYIIYRNYKEGKYYKMSYKHEDKEITFGKPVEVKMKFVKAELNTLGKSLPKGKSMTGGEKVMNKILGIGADFCESCQPILASKVKDGDLVLGEALKDTEVVKDLEGKIKELTSEAETLRTENATLKGEKEALETKLQAEEDARQKAETEKAISEKFDSLKGEYQESDHEELRNVITRQVTGYKDIEDEVERLNQATKDGEFLVSKKGDSGSKDKDNIVIVMGGADEKGIAQIVEKINPEKETIL